MKRFAFLVASLALVLSGCVIEFVPTPSSATIIGRPTLGTARQLEVDGEMQSIICNDQDTPLNYTFQFSGTLGTWRSYLKGKGTSTVEGEGTGAINPDSDVTLNLNSQGVAYDSTTNTVTVRYTLRPNSAPRLLSPSAIVPVEKLGYSILYLEVAGEKYFDELPVIANCNDFTF
jgi:hypothetical protein